MGQAIAQVATGLLSPMARGHPKFRRELLGDDSFSDATPENCDRVFGSNSGYVRISQT
jgi:hypothetical protein